MSSEKNTFSTPSANMTKASTTTLTVTTTEAEAAATASATAAKPQHPFSEINRPFREAMDDSEHHADWSFHKGDIAMDKFTSAITAFLTIFDAIGSSVITEIVRKDFRWKINGLKNAAKRLRAESVRELVRKELKSPPRFWAASGIESLLWAQRILRFVEHLVDQLEQNQAMELREAGTKAYRQTLAARHPPMTKVIFEKALNLLPPRSTFICNLSASQLCKEVDVALMQVGMKDFLRSTRPFIEALTTLFDMEEVDDDNYR